MGFHKIEEAENKNYNIESIAGKTVFLSEEFEKVGLFLKYNHDLWMKHYTDNLEAFFSTSAIGDFSKTSINEKFAYAPGSSELSNGWKETGYFHRYSVYFEDSGVIAATEQFRYNNSSIQPYHHTVCAWERGLVCKHSLMSL